MNRKEILEIRKQFKENKTTISRICCCYVNHEKEKIMENSGLFLSMSDEELFKYFEIFRKTMSGTLGKNMLNMEFPLAAEEPGGTQNFLYQLVQSRLQDEALVSEFFDKVIENYIYLENYLIILIHAVYDVPGRSSDNLEMNDASDTVYSHILCSICPVNLTKPGLAYNTHSNSLQNRTRDWVVDLPMNGFLFPAFNDRATDIHSLLYYAAKPDGDQGLQNDFLAKVLGSTIPLSAGTQKACFQDMVEESLGDNCDFDTMKAFSANLNELVEAGRELPEPPELTAVDVRNLLQGSGVPKENLTDFEETYGKIEGERISLTATNLTNTHQFHVETPGIVINAKSECADMIEMREIDGRPCLVIPVDEHVEVNGISVRAMKNFRNEAGPIVDEFTGEIIEDEI